MNAMAWLYLLGVIVLLVEIGSRLALSRFLVRELVRALILFDLAAIGLVQRVFPPRFVVLGQCQKRGECCRQLIFAPPRFLRRPAILKGMLLFHRVVHDFHLVGRGPADEYVLGCGHVRPDGHCGIYRHRPFLCRNYPVLPFFNPPQILPGCGYTRAPRVVARMQRRAALPIVNRWVAVHHPTPIRGEAPMPEHFELVDATAPKRSLPES